MSLNDWNRKIRRFAQRLKCHPRIAALIVAATLSGAVTCSWEHDNVSRTLPQAARVLDHLLSQGAAEVAQIRTAVAAWGSDLTGKVRGSSVAMISWDHVLFCLLVGMVIVELYHGIKDIIDHQRKLRSKESDAHAAPHHNKGLLDSVTTIAICILAVIPVLFYGVETMTT